MKKMRKVFALLLSFVMIMGMAVTANAATTQTTTEDTSVFKLEATVSGATVSYQAITVEGGTDSTGKTWPDSTVYNYYISLPSGSSTSAVAIKATFPADDTLYIGGTAQSATGGVYTGTVNLSSTKTFELKKGDTVVRSFEVAAGITGQTLPTVYVRVDVKNAVDWLKTNTNENTKSAVKNLTKTTGKKGYAINDDGQMSKFVPINGLESGATAMDALKAACTKLGLKIAGSDYYVSGIGLSGNLLSERATTSYSGWLYLDKPINGTVFKMANYGASAYKLNGGEQFVWCFANGWDSDQYSYLNPTTSSK